MSPGVGVEVAAAGLQEARNKKRRINVFHWRGLYI
jgi:hypothetical protein